MKILTAFLFSIITFTFLVELIAPSSSKEEIEEIVEEEPEKDLIQELSIKYGVEQPNEIVEEEIEEKVEEKAIWLPKIVGIFQNADIGFILFYIMLFTTLFLQSTFFFRKQVVPFLAVDFNLQAPPMLGVGGTIYALVNTQITESTSIIETLSAVLLGAGLTTLLGIFIFVINHFLSRYIQTK
jgi:hypothetical protein